MPGFCRLVQTAWPACIRISRLPVRIPLLAQPLINQSDPFQSLLGQTVPCAGYAPSGTLWLARRVAQEVRPDVHAYLMRNHGVVCVGTTMDEAIERVVALEQACDAWFEEQS